MSMESHSRALFNVCHYSDDNDESFELAKEILDLHPNLNVDWKSSRYGEWTPLHISCRNGNFNLAKLLLEHPAIDVNIKDFQGRTPFFQACSSHEEEIIEMLAYDVRVNMNESTPNGNCPVKMLMYSSGSIKSLEHVIASGKVIDFSTLLSLDRPSVGNNGWDEKKLEKFDKKIKVIKEFIDDPDGTRHTIRSKLGKLSLYDEPAADFFALVVFVSDGLLAVKKEDKGSKTGRFFKMISYVPLELQMLICYRVAGTSKINIKQQLSEPAFKKLVKEIVE